MHDDEPRRLNRRITAPEPGTPVFLASKGTTGTFLIQALGNNTDKIALGGEPDISLPGDELQHAGPIAAAATQNAPLWKAGYSIEVTDDLGNWWVDVRVANEGVCWLRISGPSDNQPGRARR